MTFLDHWALSGAIFVPVIGAALLGLVPRRAELTLKAGALLASLASLGLVVYLIARFDFSHSARFQFVANKQWIEVIHSRYHIGLDGISLPLLALSALITVLCVIYSWDHFPEPHNPKAFLILILVLATGMNGTFSALDLILFFVFFELVLLPMYFMIGVWGGEQRQYAAIKFFLFTLFGSALMIVSFLALYFLAKDGSGQALNSFSMIDLARFHGEGIAHGTQLLVFGGMFMGFVILGIATLTPFGLNAAVMGMVAHGLITGMLFFIAGSVKERFHTLEIKRLGGLLLQAPRMGWLLGFCVMASLGLPGLAGFWGEFPAILASYQPAAGLSDALFRTYMVVAAIGTVFAAGYLLWLLQRIAFGVPQDEWEGHDFHDVELPEWISWAPLLVLILVIGIFPNLVFHVTDPAVTSV